MSVMFIRIVTDAINTLLLHGQSSIELSIGVKLRKDECIPNEKWVVGSMTGASPVMPPAALVDYIQAHPFLT